MTSDEIVADAAASLDAIIAAKLAELEATMRQDVESTGHGPEAEAVQALLDAPRDPDAGWHPVSIEEAMAVQAEIFEEWKTSQLVRLRAFLLAWREEAGT